MCIDKTIVRFGDGLNWGNLQKYLYEAQDSVPIEVHVKDKVYVMDNVYKNLTVEMQRDSDKFRTINKIVIKCE